MAVVAGADNRSAVSRYREGCHLASGGMAELHLARMIGVGGFERLVVIKRLRADLAGAPDLVQMLLDEARIAATLQHGNIVQVHDVLFENASVSIVMEYLHGQDVRTLLRRAAAQLPGGLMPMDQAIAIALGVCAGLHHAHEQVDATGRPLDIVHRDVSADNVFVTYDGGVKLIDFGIARARSRLGQTEHGVAKGKPGYMAPEQIQCGVVDRRADVHAAAVLLYEMTCGRRPRDGETDYELFTATVDQDAISPRRVRPAYPQALEAIVLRGLARDPARRFQTAREMQLALEQFARGPGLDLSSYGLATMMAQVFRDKLDAWKAAQNAGKSLDEHVAALRMSTVGPRLADDARAAVALGAQLTPPERPDPVATTARRPGLRPARVLLGFGVLVIAVGVLVWSLSRTNRAPVASKPAPPPPSPPNAVIADPAPPTPTPAPEPTPEPTAPAPPPTVVRDPARPPAPERSTAPPGKRTTRRPPATTSRPGTTAPPSTTPPPVAPPVVAPVDPDAPLPR
jgi:hypothetical protein